MVFREILISIFYVNMLATKDLYMKACMQSKDLHVMTGEERQKLQAHLRQMYLEIEKICDRHKLRMMVGYGSVLGAIRHQGFIPWDDDIDLLMPRKDYDLFINEYAEELPDCFKVYAPNSKNGPICRFAKVVDTSTRFLGPGQQDCETHGMFIDIFPLEYAPQNKFILSVRNHYTRFLILIAECVISFEQNNKFYEKLMCSTFVGKVTYGIRYLIGWLFHFRKGIDWYNRISRYEYYKKETGLYNIPSDGGLKRSLVPLSEDLYFPTKKVKFDEIEVYVPNQSIKYLEHNYGDWKWIPPVEDRWQHFIQEIRFPY